MSKKIGLFGYGAVAQGFYKALDHNQQLDCEIVKICVKHEDKVRELDASLFTIDPTELINDPSIDIIIELIDDADAAFHIVKNALDQKKAVISANKRMVAEHIEDVAHWHLTADKPFFYEAAVGGSIPIIQNLEQIFKQQEVTSIRGILNGSTNYILTRMREQKLSFDEALGLAQSEGFAESDPTLDISGRDAMYKLIILAYHAFGVRITNYDDIRLESITNMEDQFYDLAELQGMKIKSIATAYRKNDSIRLKVQPELIDPADDLFGIEEENNSIIVDASFSGKQIYTGKGAGSLPTASAVINDLALLLKGFRYTANSDVKSPLKKSA
ncbi:MAG: homoserine dehydrogenase [Marinoscillum sp.]